MVRAWWMVVALLAACSAPESGSSTDRGVRSGTNGRIEDSSDALLTKAQELQKEIQRCRGHLDGLRWEEKNLDKIQSEARRFETFLQGIESTRLSEPEGFAVRQREFLETVSSEQIRFIVSTSAEARRAEPGKMNDYPYDVHRLRAWSKASSPDYFIALNEAIEFYDERVRHLERQQMDLSREVMDTVHQHQRARASARPTARN